MCVPSKKGHSESNKSTLAEPPPSQVSTKPLPSPSPDKAKSAKTRLRSDGDTVEDKTQNDPPKEDVRRLQVMYNAMGLEGNATRILKKQRKTSVSPTTTPNLQKSGDIVYSFKKPGLTKSKSGDDTVYQKKPKEKYTYDNKGKGASTLPLFEPQRDPAEDEEPNEQNFMMNQKDMQYVAHEMMYTYNEKLLTKMEKKKFDPYGPLEGMENDKCFGWNQFRVNTLLSNATTLPTEAEVHASPRKPRPRSRERHVVWQEPAALTMAEHDTGEEAELTANEYVSMATREEMP